MTRIRRRYDREFKISIISELEGGKSLAQISRENGVHPSLPCRWRDEFAENPEKAFGGNGNRYKDQARIAELERLLDKAHAEVELLKKASAKTQLKVQRGETKTSTEIRFRIIQEAISDGISLSISDACQALEVSRSGYYKWLNGQEKVQS